MGQIIAGPAIEPNPLTLFPSIIGAVHARATHPSLTER
jgi:hypothetical protein